MCVCVGTFKRNGRAEKGEREKKKRHNVNGVFPWARRRRIWKFLSESIATSGNRMDVPATGGTSAAEEKQAVRCQ